MFSHGRLCVNYLQTNTLPDTFKARTLLGLWIDAGILTDGFLEKVIGGNKKKRKGTKPSAVAGKKRSRSTADVEEGSDLEIVPSNQTAVSSEA